MVSLPSTDSQEQRVAERLILDGVEREVNVALEPKRLALGSGAAVDVDGVSGDESVLVEVFAHHGQLKGGQPHKIAGDALKLITLAHERRPRPRLVLAFADEKLAEWSAGKSWLASMAERSSVGRRAGACLVAEDIARRARLGGRMGSSAASAPSAWAAHSGEPAEVSRILNGSSRPKRRRR